MYCASGRAGLKNSEFYHDRCIAATLGKFLLQESKFPWQPENPYAIVGRKSVFPIDHRKTCRCAAKKTVQPQQLKPKG
jgi:hypothetical protein